MRRALLAAALLFALAVPAHATTISVNTWDPGGDVDTYEMWWKRIAAAGVNVRINGPCVSACTMVLGLVPPSRVCVTPRGKFGIHMVTVDGRPHRRETRYFVGKYYPKWLQAWLKTKPKLTIDLLWLKPADIGNRIKRCK